MSFVAFQGVPNDEVLRLDIQEALLEELALGPDAMRVDVRGSGTGWWSVKLTRMSDRRSQSGVVTVNEDHAAVLRKLARSLMEALGRDRG